ncbi:hypothetical protein JIQ42_02321 [Leishmania sp. Namibia]|uniref:hypothetical protein n=1 Tax=Leishmania sp. Namibia TaxID=2802991 RepID=UPI001B4ED25C|nr:hypothetical protein JIQ42_02321 [Leishmania sp. Namibia]
MSDAFENRMSAMRARLSSLSRTVEQQEQEQLLQQRASGHRCSVEETTGSAAAGQAAAKSVPPVWTPPFPVPVSRPITNMYPLPRTNGISERDPNQLRDPPKRSALPAHHCSKDMTSASITRTRAAQPVPRLNAMLQLARHHATTSPPEATVIKDAVPLTGAPLSQVPSVPAALSPTTSTAKTPPRTTDSLHIPRVPGGATGLHSYSFQERFPSPRRLTASLEASGLAPVFPDEEGRTPYNRAHNVTGITAGHAAANVSTNSDEAMPFDAFRVVQERLRQKIKQLTTPSSQRMAPPSMGGTLAESTPCTGATAHQRALSSRESQASQGARGFDDSSPSPRPPPGTRAGTATPTRSPDEHDAMSCGTPPPPSAPSCYQHGKGDVSIEVEVFPPTSECTTENASRTRPRTNESLYDRVEDCDAATVIASELHGSQGRVPSQKAEAVSLAREVYRDPTARGVRVSRMPSSDARSKPIAAGQRSGSHEFRRQSEGAIAESAQGDRGKSGPPTIGAPHGVASEPRRSVSMSAARSCATRERSRSAARASYRSVPQTAARSKPISLNVEATILCAVTGAELFALLRMRGLITSEGNTEEYRLPPARCHRLYVTPEEHRQLKLLRQSLHFLAAEEQRQDIPSYQRVTVSARSRNAEFVSPPPVSRYMDV